MKCRIPLLIAIHDRELNLPNKKQKHDKEAENTENNVF